MATPRTVHLTADQIAELTRLRDQHPKSYVRERAAAILKVASGWSVRRVALHGLLRPRRPETVGDWIGRYLEVGRGGLEVAPGRGRKPDPPPGVGRGRGIEGTAGSRPKPAPATLPADSGRADASPSPAVRGGRRSRGGSPATAGDPPHEGSALRPTARPRGHRLFARALRSSLRPEGHRPGNATSVTGNASPGGGERSAQRE